MTVIDDYFRTINPSQRSELERIRTIIKKAIPDVEETIGYGMPVFKFNKKYLVGICAFKNHMSLFPGPEAIEAHKKELTNFTLAKGTIQFTQDNPVPETIITAIVLYRKDEILTATPSK